MPTARSFAASSPTSPLAYAPIPRREPTDRDVEIGQQVRKSELVFFRQIDGW